MLVLHMLTTFLTFSYAKANPVEIALSSYHKHTPTTDCSTGVESYLTAAATNPAFASFASTGTSLARPMVTSLTESYFEKRQKTCIEQFAWYCQLPAGACLTTLTALGTSPFAWGTLVPCVMLAICASRALDWLFLLSGNHQGLRCSHPITGNVMLSRSNGNTNEKAGDTFAKQQFREAYYGYLSSHGATAFPSNDEFYIFYTAFQYRMFCSHGPGESGPACTPDVITRSQMDRYMKGE
ncbi:hypothetical protein B0H13DRAFT_2293033 [Mycena leptocephala]|nr:hypothetical protein B0H13DRAFT_2293033 [Mycena leptocephala]